MSIEVIRPGLLSTIQDEGRTGYRRYGIHPGGVMDTFAARAANMLVGNPRNVAVLEMTMTGPELRFQESQLVSLCGADLSATVDHLPVPLWRPVLVRAGSVLKFGPCRHGLRCYLAFAGGIAVPEEMGSRSTNLKTGLGGLEGRALHVADLLSTGEPSGEAQGWMKRMEQQVEESEWDRRILAPAWFLSERERPDYYGRSVIRVMESKDSSLFSEASLGHFYAEKYVISPQSDRMGYRLQGSRLELNQPLDRLSEAVTYGTVQVPPDGQPIILMADHQTIGGYPVIAQVAQVDMPILAQARPGNQISFEQITHDQARQLYMEQECNMQLMDKLIRRRMVGMESTK
ncbi:biotin-dependent carboxyltransferase family protein [Paenibacillus sp. 1781tsa1]|uniref:5-oxoprolinase subunit C family protein n=1 Tax=Paenibacillus sp. 1781tsa1 TaxID=2953810 RepID=UPI0020A1D467|nr:biotin-dependent carboxyltransferase family protein [Paenibacillus sp. 1781tsa1]MCP1181856.1 biotin-dependent carboxyltransferase family protein [Paenibacillus sp. 1781tsa1]